MITRYTWIFCGLFLSLLVHRTQAENTDYPLEITADVIECEKNDNVCVAKDNVNVLYEDPLTKDDMSTKAAADSPKKQDDYTYHMTCKHLTVTFEKDAQSEKDANSASVSDATSMLGSKNINNVLAKGSVVVVRSLKSNKEDPLIIKAEKATYNPKTEQIEFFDNVRIKDGKRAYSESHYAAMNKRSGEYSIGKGNANMGHTHDGTTTINKRPQTKLLLKTAL